jgi:hypothetical protein
MKPVGLISILYVVDLKTIYLDIGVYKYAIWISELKHDFLTYASISSYVRRNFANLLQGSERRAVLSKVLKASADFFITKEIWAFIEFLNFEYSPAGLGPAQPMFNSIFTDAIQECTDRIINALPRLGYTSVLDFNTQLSYNNNPLVAPQLNIANAHSGLDYIIVGEAFPGGVLKMVNGVPIVQYVRGSVSQFVNQLQGEGVIVAVPAGGPYTQQLMGQQDNYPFVKLKIRFDDVSQALSIDDPVSDITQKLKSNEPLTITVRLRTQDQNIGHVRMIRWRGHIFMADQSSIIPMLSRVQPADFGASSMIVAYVLKTEKRLTDLPVENISTFVL